MGLKKLDISVPSAGETRLVMQHGALILGATCSVLQIKNEVRMVMMMILMMMMMMVTMRKMLILMVMLMTTTTFR